MQGAPRRQVRSSARSFFLLPSVLALLALALFPVSAFANSGETVYETEVPTIESEAPSTGNNSGESPTHHKPKNNAQAEGSAADESSSGGVEEAEGEGGSSEGGHKQEGSTSEEEEGNPSTAAGGGGDKPSGGAQGGNGPEGSIGEQKNLGSTQSGQNAAAKSDGGSSPVVPILIAVVVLAAISIGVVLYRQRKSGQDGSDGRFSSSNAS